MEYMFNFPNIIKNKEKKTLQGFCLTENPHREGVISTQCSKYDQCQGQVER